MRSYDRNIWYPALKTGSVDVGSGDYDIYISNSDSKDEDGFETDDSDYDVFIEEVSDLRGKTHTEKWESLENKFILSINATVYTIHNILSLRIAVI